jgi:hypothetical protein
MSEKKIERAVDAASFKALLPQDSRLKIARLNLGVEVHYYTYISSVSGAPGGSVSGGGTAGGSYRTYDFGYDVENVSDISMRVQFTTAKMSKDGYSLEKRHSWVDVIPGEKSRVWSGLSLKPGHDFKSQIISEIGIGPTPPVGAKGVVTWSEKTSPNKSLYEVFGLEKAALRLDSKQGKILLLGVLSWLCLGPFASIPALVIAAMNRPLNTRGKIGVGLALFSLAGQMLTILVVAMPGPTHNWHWLQSIHF